MYRKKIDNALTLFCSPRALVACNFERSNTQLQLHDYHSFTFSHFEFERSILFNPTRIASFINSFLPSASTPIFISLYGPRIINKCVNLPTAHPQPHDFSISRSPHWYWNYCYLYPFDHSHYFYTCGIPRELIFQWQLIALREQWNIRYISSEQIALLQLYKYLFGAIFRPSQLGIHLQQKNNNIDRLLSRDDLMRIMKTSIPIPEENTGPLLTSCGLFIAGEQYA